MSPEKKPALTLLKVDNWGVFLLQRLQLMFAKGDFCDLTLKFQDDQELKVHRLVLTTCTKYFQEIKESDDTYKMPDSLSYNAMLPIVNFMYSGRLEFKPELHDSLLFTAKALNMAILVQLLIAQKNPKDKTIKLKKEEAKKTLKVLSPNQSSGGGAGTGGATAQSSNVVSMLSEKKLPFWRKRVYPHLRLTERKEIIPEEDPMPTRFEWPSEDTSTLIINSPSFSSISYESEPVISSCLELKNEAGNDLGGVKRRVVPPLFSSTPCKAPRLAEQSQIIMGTLSDEDDDGHFETLHSYEDSDDETAIVANEATTPQQQRQHQISEVETTPKPILKPQTASPGPSCKKVRFCLEDKENVLEDKPMEPEKSQPENKTQMLLIPVQNEGGDTPGGRPQHQTPPSTPKTTLPNHEPKTNRISKSNPTEEDKETSNSRNLVLNNRQTDSVPNHAKIIAEVLKKFPDLVKNNKNIKLKITTPGNPGNFKTITLDSTNGSINPPTKSSIVVVKPTSKANDKSQNSQENSMTDVDNVTGPWICRKCSAPQNFESYFLFRKHLQSVHMEKLDTKVCEYCGYKASKRNLHLFHLYTKHNVPPPRNIKFPKCDVCNYVALNDNLLSKHLSSHQSTKELICNICKLSFKSSNSFQAHCVTCKPSNEIRNYTCNNCQKSFRTNVSLKAHFKDCTPIQSSGGGGTSLVSLNNAMDQPMEVIQVPLMESMGSDKTELMQLPPGLIVTESSNVTLLQDDSSGLSNVTSSMPSSIGFTVLPEDHQTVILLDENSEFFLQGNNSVVVTSENESQEYIVPDILPENVTRLYTTGNISYAMNATSVITYPMVHVPDHHHGGGNTLTIPVSEGGELYVSNKDIAISMDQSVELQNQLEGQHVSVATQQELAKHDPSTIEGENVEFVKTDDGNCLMTLSNSQGNPQDCGLDEVRGCLVPVPMADNNDGGATNTAQVVSQQQNDVDNTSEGTTTMLIDNVSQQTSSSPANTLKPGDLHAEWDFENEEEEENKEIADDDSEIKPSRPSIELQEII